MVECFFFNQKLLSCECHDEIWPETNAERKQTMKLLHQHLMMYSICISESSMVISPQICWPINVDDGRNQEYHVRLIYFAKSKQVFRRYFSFLFYFLPWNPKLYSDLVWYLNCTFMEVFASCVCFFLYVYMSFCYISFRSEMSMNLLRKPIYLYCISCMERRWNRNVLFNDTALIFHCVNSIWWLSPFIFSFTVLEIVCVVAFPYHPSNWLCCFVIFRYFNHCHPLL